MAVYIDKNDLREYISGYIKSCNGKPTYTDIDAMVGIISLLEQMPAADVQPIRCGRWVTVRVDGDSETICNNCYENTIMRTDFCPHCGARMDGEQNEVL